MTPRGGTETESVADALQYISYFHPMDYIRDIGDMGSTVMLDSGLRREMPSPRSSPKAGCAPKGIA